MNRDLDEVVSELARLGGSSSFDVADTHSRWGVYLSALGSPDRSELLREAVKLESDHALALSIVLRLLDEIPVDDRDDWVSQLRTDKDREYAARRKDELAILERARRQDTSLDWVESEGDGWSDWLQVRLAEFATDRRILKWLVERGRTKRIRRIAEGRLRDWVA